MKLPPEVYLNIAQHVEMRADLYALCLVSRGFRTAAERVLYRALDTSEPSNTIMLCRVLAEQPRLSRLVTTFAIYLDEEGQGGNRRNSQEQEPSSSLSQSHYYWTSISCALRNTASLRLLRVHLNGGIPINYAWILDGCSFQLHTFHCDLAWDVHLISFLITQRELTDLHISDFDGDVPENLSISTHSLRQAHTLPRLSILDCTFTEAVGLLVPGRPVTHVKTCFSSSNREARRVELALLLTDLRLSIQPIYSLTVADESYTSTFSLELLSSLVKSFGPTPQLRYLGPLALPVDGNEVGDARSTTGLPALVASD
jgi:F-box-like